MRVGFTGTQHGTTQPQRDQVDKLFQLLRPSQFHHGDCVGADAEAHNRVHNYMYFTNALVEIHIHPPIDPKKRAWKQGDVLHPEKPYLERNWDIVVACEVLIATPHTSVEQKRSGTWSTVRYAKKNGKPVFVILPDGEIKTFL